MVHLSDIHFRKGFSANIHDADAVIRSELENDLRRLTLKFERFDAIVVSGDIAFAGLAEEFELAESWLKHISDEIGCEKILVTPGNHDVCRTTAENVWPIHQRILGCAGVGEQETALAQCLLHNTEGGQLLGPISEYNKFARKYQCEVSSDLPYWEHSFLFGDGTNLKVRGITTTLLSSAHDNDDQNANNLLYGVAQRNLIRRNGEVFAIVGHHPPSWMLDGDQGERTFSERSVLQLFGHEHRAWIHASEYSVRVCAGAVNPSAREPQWLPRYNVVGLSKRGQELNINLFPRRWTSDYGGGQFMADFDPEANEFQVKKIRLLNV